MSNKNAARQPSRHLVRRRPMGMVAAAVAAMVALGAGGLAGCASPGGVSQQSTLETPEFVGATTDRAAQDSIDWPQDKWWTLVQDAQLDGLMEQALRDAPSMKVVQARAEQAAAQSELVRAIALPQVQLGGSVTRERLSEHYLYPHPLAGSMVNDGVLQARAQWSPDVFNRQQAQLAAAVGAAKAAEADRAMARWALSTQIASSYLQLTRLVALREVAQSTLKQRERILDLVADRVRAGLDTNVELHQAEGSVPQIRQNIEQLTEEIELSRHALTALAGLPVHALDNLSPRLVTLPLSPVADVIPAELIGHRPDVVGARWRVEAALRGVDEARAEFYPNINLAAFFDFHALGLSNWLIAGSREFGVAPAISLPLFDGGRLRAGLRERAAQADSAIEIYNQILLLAVKDVADAVSSNRSVTRQQEQQTLAQTAAESAYDLALTRYKAGLGTYLTVLSAEGGVLTQHREAIELKAQALKARVALVRALGGGYQQADLPGKADSSPDRGSDRGPAGEATRDHASVL